MAKDKSSIKDKGVIVEVEKGVMRVNGLNGYHAGKIERARQRVYVGCSMGMV